MLSVSHTLAPHHKAQVKTVGTAERSAKHILSPRRNTEKSREETRTRNLEPLAPEATKKIKHNTTLSQININLHTDSFSV